MIDQLTLADAQDLAIMWQDVVLDDQQRACLANVLAKLCTTPKDEPFIHHVNEVLAVRQERLYLGVDSLVFDDLVRLSQTGTDIDLFVAEGTPSAPIHQELLAWIDAQGPQTRFVLHSFRERVTHHSLQVVIARPLAENGNDWTFFADVDIDLGGARTDVVGFFTHMGELASHKPTNHVALQAKLAQDPDIAPYLAALTV